MGEEMGKTIVFIGQQADVLPLLSIVRDKHEGEVVLVAASTLLVEEIERNGMSCRSLSSYLPLERDEEIKKTAVDWFDAWGDQCQWDGRSYKEAVELEGVGAWWFLLPVLIPDVLRCIQYVEELLALIKTERPASLWLVDVERRQPYPLRLGLDLDLPGKMAAIVCREQGINVQPIKPPLRHRLGWWAEHARARGGIAFYYAFVRAWVVRWRVWLTRSGAREQKNSEKGTVALVTSPVYWRQTLNLNGEKTMADAIAGTSMEALGAQGYRLLGIDVDLSAPNYKQFDILRQKRLSPDIQWRAIEHYYRRSRKTNHLRRARLNEMECKLGAAAVCQRGMLYRNIDIAPLLAGRFNYLFAHYLAGAMEYLDALEYMLECEKVELVLIVYEEGPAGRSATLAGQRRGVPTLALQHGTLTNAYTPAYYLPAVTTSADGGPTACPVPTVTAVYGEHTRAMLVESSSYPPENVVTVGMPAYDGVARSLQMIDRDDSRRMLVLQNDRPMVLIISQPFLNPENRDYFASTVIDAAERMPDIQWAVKLHPSEGAGAWTQYLHNRSSNVRVFGDELHRLLSACDIVVAWHSTVILEAALFARPVISVTIPGSLAPVDYIRDGLVIMAENATDIASHVDALLYNGDLRQRHLQKTTQALGLYIYQPDGAATERVVGLAETLIQQGLIAGRGKTHREISK